MKFLQYYLEQADENALAALQQWTDTARLIKVSAVLFANS